MRVSALAVIELLFSEELHSSHAYLCISTLVGHEPNTAVLKADYLWQWQHVLATCGKRSEITGTVIRKHNHLEFLHGEASNILMSTI